MLHVRLDWCKDERNDTRLVIEVMITCEYAIEKTSGFLMEVFKLIAPSHRCRENPKSSKIAKPECVTRRA